MGSAVPASAETPDSHVTTVGFTYVPGNTKGFVPPLVVSEGGRLLYTNAEIVLAPHSVTDEGCEDVLDTLPCRFDSGIQGVGKTVEVEGVPDLQPGTYPFFCEVHDWMRGTLVVIEGG